MPASIGVNLRVTGHCRQGGRKYMEDFFSVAYQQTEDEKDLEYAFFGIYDGHGGAEAAAFAKEHLMETIIKHKNFWSDCDGHVLRAIKDGYTATHYAMWREQEKWPRTASGLPSTAGTTASVAFIRRGKIYTGHVGDSGIVLGYQEPGCSEWKARALTRDHKPENTDEMDRINKCGGKVVSKSGVPRVVWNRPRVGHQGPVRRSTPIDEIPFLAVARSLGDLWSYNSQLNQFIVSPDPDCAVLKIDTNVHRCLIFGTDGLYNMLSPPMAVYVVQQAEKHNESVALSDSTYKTWMNPSKLLVEKALERWQVTKMRADNTSVVTLMLDPPGPPRAQVLKDRKKNLPERGLRIMTRFDAVRSPKSNCESSAEEEQPTEPAPALTNTTVESAPATETNLLLATDPVPYSDSQQPKEKEGDDNQPEKDNVPATDPSSESGPSVTSSGFVPNYPLKERNSVPKPRESTSFDTREFLPQGFVDDDGKENQNHEAATNSADSAIQCNEVSSSNIGLDGTYLEPDGSNKAERHNLRSSKNEKAASLQTKEEKVRPGKRKIESEGRVQLRKSMRLDQNQKKVDQTPKRYRRACRTDEVLKSIAKSSVKIKKLSNKLAKAKIVSKIVQNTENKKNVLTVKQVRRKIELASSSVRNQVSSVEKTKLERRHPEDNQKLLKILTSKMRIRSKQNDQQNDTVTDQKQGKPKVSKEVNKVQTRSNEQINTSLKVLIRECRFAETGANETGGADKVLKRSLRSSLNSKQETAGRSNLSPKTSSTNVSLVANQNAGRNLRPKVSLEHTN